MSKKWEKAQPVVLDYLDNNPNCYLNDIVDALNLSAYVISTALKKAGRYNEINLGLSPKKKLVRDAKLSQIISEKYAKGEINKCEYDDNWKEKVKQGRAQFDNDPKAKAEAAKKRDFTCRKRYGDDYRSQNQEKAKHTKLEKYGSENYNNQEKAKKTKLERYGDENYNNREQARQTNLKKYGGTGNASYQLLKKYEQTSIERYGVKTNLLSDDPYLNGQASIEKRFGSNKARYKYSLAKGQETRLEKYRDPYYSNHEQAKATMLEKYGVEYYCLTPECRKQSRISKASNDFYNFLLETYDVNDIEREYKDKNRYPFFCDFYIKSEDLFIECNFHWTHGPHPFDSTSAEDNKLKKSWLSENSEFYKHAVYVWTDLDIRKQSIANKNKLNYQMVYIDQGGKYAFF